MPFDLSSETVALISIFALCVAIMPYLWPLVKKLWFIINKHTQALIAIATLMTAFAAWVAIFL